MCVVNKQTITKEKVLFVSNTVREKKKWSGIYPFLYPQSRIPPVESFFRLLDFSAFEKDYTIRVRSLLTMRCMLLGFSSQHRPKAERWVEQAQLWPAAYQLKRMLSSEKPVWRGKTRLTGPEDLWHDSGKASFFLALPRSNRREKEALLTGWQSCWLLISRKYKNCQGSRT